ncbi:MAG: transporter [Myxococcales bacterium]|nr:transporter [Myxococcales bacterium]
MSPRWCLLWLCALAALPARAQVETASDSANGCGRWIAAGLPEGPVALGLLEADVATGRRACPRTEVGLMGRAGAVIDNADFYGAIGASGAVFGSYAASPKLELFGTFEALRYEYVQNATLKGSSTSLGQLTAGATYLGWQSGELLLGASGRVMLPTGLYTGIRVMGFEVSGVGSYRFGERLELHGHLGSDTSFGLSAAQPLPRAGMLLGAGAQYSPCSRLGVVLDLNGRFGPTSYFAPALALRFRIAGGLGGELAATAPLLGTDRHDAMLGLRLGYRLQ